MVNGDEEEHENLYMRRFIYYSGIKCEQPPHAKFLPRHQTNSNPSVHDHYFLNLHLIPFQLSENENPFQRMTTLTPLN